MRFIRSKQAVRIVHVQFVRGTTDSWITTICRGSWSNEGCQQAPLEHVAAGGRRRIKAVHLTSEVRGFRARRWRGPTGRRELARVERRRLLLLVRGGVGCGGDDGADGAQPGAEGSIANLPARRPAKALLITNSRRRLQISAAEAPTGILYMLRIAGLYDLVV